MQELAGAICLLANGKAVGPDGVSVELFKITLKGIPPCAGDCSISSFVFGGGTRCRSSGNMSFFLFCLLSLLVSERIPGLIWFGSV